MPSKRRLTVGSLKQSNHNLYNQTIVVEENSTKPLQKQKICFAHHKNNFCVDLATNHNFNETLLDFSTKQDINIEYKCKQGKCGKCEVGILEGYEFLSEPSDAETKKLGKKLKNKSRLACQTYIKGNKAFF